MREQNSAEISAERKAELQAFIEKIDPVNPLSNKRLAKAYMWLGFLGFFGAHRLYLKSQWGFVQFSLALLSIGAFVPLYFVVNRLLPDETGIAGWMFLLSIFGLLLNGVWVVVENFLLHGRASYFPETEGKMSGKRLATAFVLLNLLSSFGAHRLYLKNWLGAVQLILGIAAIFGGMFFVLAASAPYGVRPEIEVAAIIYYIGVLIFIFWHAVIDRIWLYRRA